LSMKIQFQNKDYIEAEIDENLLIRQAIGGDTDAFGKLYFRHVERVYRHIYYWVHNIDDAKDLTQQVFVKAWQAIGKYKITASPFSAWLITIGHNFVIDFYRTRKKKHVYIEYDTIPNESSSSLEEMAESKFLQETLRNAILQLPNEQQQVIQLRFIENFKHAEIAALLGKSEGAVRVIQYRALMKLRNILEKDREDI
jgi:RNA polymerase sigma-70 factor (ECF subfamily)